MILLVLWKLLTGPSLAWPSPHLDVADPPLGEAGRIWVRCPIGRDLPRLASALASNAAK